MLDERGVHSRGPNARRQSNADFVDVLDRLDPGAPAAASIGSNEVVGTQVTVPVISVLELLPSGAGAADRKLAQITVGELDCLDVHKCRSQIDLVHKVVKSAVIDQDQIREGFGSGVAPSGA